MRLAIESAGRVERPQGLASQYISAVRDVGTNYRAANGRGYSSNAELDFHVDVADLTILTCYNKAKSGGQSMISSGVTAQNYLIEERPDLADWWIETETLLSAEVGKGAYFRRDHPSYADMKVIATTQESFDFGLDETIPCFCGE